MRTQSPYWIKKTVTYADTPAPGFANTVVLTDLDNPLDTVIGVAIVITEAFLGGTVATSHVVGYFGSYIIIPSINTFTPVLLGNGTHGQNREILANVSGAANNLNLLFSCTGGFLNDMTQGSMDVYYLISQINAQGDPLPN